MWDNFKNFKFDISNMWHLYAAAAVLIAISVLFTNGFSSMFITFGVLILVGIVMKMFIDAIDKNLM